LRDVADAQLDIGDALAEGASPESVSVRGVGRRDRVVAVAALLAAVLLTLTLLLRDRLTQQPATTQPIARTAVLFPTDHELDRTDRAYPLTVSPDGKRLAYVALQAATRYIFLRELDALVPKRVAGTEGARYPFFSRDGKWIGFFAAGLLKKVAVSGGVPLQICVVRGDPFGASWGVDGTIVFATGGAGLSTVPSGGGEPQAIPSSDGATWPEILPGGKVLFTARDGTAFATMSLDGSAKQVVARRSDVPGEGAAVLGTAFLLQAHYVSTGHLVYGQSPGIVRAVAYDLASSQLRGSPASLIDSAFEAPASGAVYFTVSDSGLLAYAPEDRNRELTWLDSHGREAPLITDRQAFRFPRLSPDGKRLAVSIDDDTRRSDIWIYNIQDGTRRRVTSSDHNLAPVWTPDGRRITYYRSGSVVSQSVDAEGPPSETLLKGPDYAYTPTSWSPDGRELVVMAANPKTLYDLLLVSRHTVDHSRPLLTGPFRESDGRFSPDGRWLAFVTDESGTPNVLVTPYPALQPKVPISTVGGHSPVWSRDGRQLLYRQNLAMMSVALDLTGGFHASAPRLLFPASSYVGAGGDPSFDIAPDGRFLMTKVLDPAALRQLVVVHNWTEELKERVPTR
jgi:Tol biopolymer transport system component